MEAERLPNVARGSVGGNHLDVPASLGELAASDVLTGAIPVGSGG